MPDTAVVIRTYEEVQQSILVEVSETHCVYGIGWEECATAFTDPFGSIPVDIDE